MKEKKPIAFKIFILTLSITALVFIGVNVCSYLHMSRKYAMLLVCGLFIAISISTIGIYTGFKEKPESERHKILNKLGLIGNLVIYIITIAIMLLTAFFTPPNL